MEQANELRKIAYLLYGISIAVEDGGYEEVSSMLYTLKKKLMEIADELDGNKVEEQG